jgi:hypothetical protein
MPDHAAHTTGDGSGHYGGWHVMEVIERYADSIGVAFALKHILRKPKADEGYGTRIQDLKKAITYLQREVALREAEEAANAQGS